MPDLGGAPLESLRTVAMAISESVRIHTLPGWSVEARRASMRPSLSASTTEVRLPKKDPSW